MVKVYAIALTAGVVALIVVLLGTALPSGTDRDDGEPSLPIGINGKSAIGAAIGFGMGGLSAELSPIDLGWPMALLIAVLAGGLSTWWVRYAVAQSEPR